jgi:hypothetical protein
MRGKKFPGGRPEQRIAAVRYWIARTVLPEADWKRWQTSRSLRRRPWWLYDRVHEVLWCSPPDPGVLIRLVAAFGIEGARAIVDAAEFGPASRIALIEALAGRDRRSRPWGSPWGSSWEGQ